MRQSTILLLLLFTLVLAQVSMAASVATRSALPEALAAPTIDKFTDTYWLLSALAPNIRTPYKQVYLHLKSDGSVDYIHDGELYVSPEKWSFSETGGLVIKGVTYVIRGGGSTIVGDGYTYRKQSRAPRLKRP